MDEFMLDENILVLQILEKSINKRSVCLSSGKWYSFYDKMPIEGGAITIAAAAINQIPLYVKEDSFIISNINLTSIKTTAITKEELLVEYSYGKLPST